MILLNPFTNYFLQFSPIPSCAQNDLLKVTGTQWQRVLVLLHVPIWLLGPGHRTRIQTQPLATEWDRVYEFWPVEHWKEWHLPPPGLVSKITAVTPGLLMVTVATSGATVQGSRAPPALTPEWLSGPELPYLLMPAGLRCDWKIIFIEFNHWNMGLLLLMVVVV